MVRGVKYDRSEIVVGVKLPSRFQNCFPVPYFYLPALKVEPRQQESGFCDFKRRVWVFIWCDLNVDFKAN